MIPCFENKKTVSWLQKCFMFPEDIWYILPTFHFMFFDRYEIHIQVFVHFINGELIIFNPHLHKDILRNIYSEWNIKPIFQNIFLKQIFQTHISENMFWNKMVGVPFTNFESFRFLDSQIWKIFCEDDSICFLYWLSHFGNN